MSTRQDNVDDEDISLDSSDYINHVQGENEPLYPGCENFTKMRALVKLYNLKAKHGISDKCFFDVLILLASMLPEGNNMPSSFTEAKKTLCALGMDYEKIHACSNDCLIYCGEKDKDEMICRICGASKLNKKGEEVEGVPAKVLWGNKVYDGYKKKSFLLRGILLWKISDYPALGNLSGNIIKGYNACVVCADKTKATRLANYKKTVVMRHRRWLPRNHPYRRQKSAFDNTLEKLTAPIPLTGEEVLESLLPLMDHVYVLHTLDVMHIEKNICEALTGTLLNIPGKTKDREYVRIDMAEMGIRTELRPKNPRKKEATNGIISMETLRLVGMKSHDCHTVLHHLLPIALRSTDFIRLDLLDVTSTVTKELIWIAEGPNKYVPAFSGYKIKGVIYITKDRDETRQVQFNGVCVDVDTIHVQGKDTNIEHISYTFYGVITSIWELDYNHFHVPIFRCNWVDMNKGVKVDDLGYTVVNLQKIGFMNDPFVLGKHVKQVCYIDDPLEKFWSVVLRLPDKYNDQSDDENEGSVEIELENELDATMFPVVDHELEEENNSYMHDKEEMIQLS
ncbi:uncharacterized protein LOC141719109 [Apium graveolens]|uniref:uncharacterized protein LOC141719109 n=1 Tax=Apium graveolens TaxID=4045 RepID=UPI003D798D11